MKEKLTDLKNLNYTYTNDFYDSADLAFSWKMYKGYNNGNELNYIPDSINWVPGEIKYNSCLTEIFDTLAKEDISFLLVGKPVATLDEDTINKTITETNKDLYAELGEEYYIVKYKDIIYTEIFLGIGYRNTNGIKIMKQIEYLVPPNFIAENLPMSSVIKIITKVINDVLPKSIHKINKKNNVTISMLNQRDSGFYLDEFDITKQTDLVKEYDLFYGEGFKKFNDFLVKRISSGSKGLILFHGPPGTGKTYYIKSLIHQLQLVDSKSIIIYTPVSMVENLNGPSFLNLLKDNAGKNIILLIEDAEEILMDREKNRFTSSISNILNSTSGILNDIFGISIIATFNSDLDTIDSALLRNERLLAMKEFKLIDKEDALKIAKFLKVTKTFKKIKDFDSREEFSIADVTSSMDDHNIIEHNIPKKESTRKIGFGGR